MNLNSKDRFFLALIWGSRLSTFLLLVILALALDSSATTRNLAEVRQQWQSRLDDISRNLQSVILRNMQTVWGMAANVAVQPDMDSTRFERLAQVITRMAPELRNIGLAPDYIIRDIYPMAGNEAALGLDLTLSSLPPAQIRAMQETRQIVYTGPIKLIQGGHGLAGRIPVFEQDSGRLWGVISVILDMDRLYQRTGLLTLDEDMRLAISSSDRINNTRAMFFGDIGTGWQNPVKTTLNLSNASWTLFAEPWDGWPGHPRNPWLLRSALTLMILFGTWGSFWLTGFMLKDREMQRRFWSLFELAPIGVALYSVETLSLIRANRTFEQSFGKSAERLDYFENMLDKHGEPLAQQPNLLERLRTSIRFSGLEGYYRKPDQSLLPVMLQGMRIDNKDNDPVIWLITEDMSERRKVDRMKSEFISTVSHELRTPLTSITGALGLITNGTAGVLPEKAEGLAKIAYRNSQQLSFLINDLLDIEKLMAGKMPFVTDNYRLAEIVEESVENIQPFARERKVAIDITELAQVQVRVDRQRFAQAISNLLSNSIKFSPTGTSVDIFTRLVDQSVRLCIRDRGPGISLDFHDRIFQKFSQADSSDQRSKSGTGLGLAITRELISQMGGKVDFESVPGQGATFWLEIPIARDPEAQTES